MTAAFIFLNSLFHFFISPFWEPEEPEGAHVRRIAKYSQQMHVAPTPTGPNWELVLYSLQTGWRSYVKRLGAVNFNGTFNDITTGFIAIVLKIIERKRSLCQTGVHRGMKERGEEREKGRFFLHFLSSFFSDCYDWTRYIHSCSRQNLKQTLSPSLVEAWTCGVAFQNTLLH